MTQGQLGAALPNPVHAKTVGRWERGGTYPRGQLTALERVLGVRLTNSNEGQGPSQPVHPLSEVERLSDDELVATLFRVGAEMARRLPSTDMSLTPGGALERGLTVTRRDQHDTSAHAPSPAKVSEG